MTGNRGERRRREDENEVLDAAMRLFISQGYHGTSMQQIAAAAEFSVGKIYTLFNSKEELLRSLQSRTLREAREVLGAPGREALPPLVALLELMRAGFAFATLQRDIIRVEVAEHLGRPEGEGRSLDEMLRDEARAHLDRAVAGGELKPVDTLLLATMIEGAGHALVAALAGRDGPDPYAEIPDRIMDLMVRPHLMNPEAGR
jgi:AcrR family transcriptional regulator